MVAATKRARVKSKDPIFCIFFNPRADPEAIGNTVNCAKFHSGSHSAAIHFTVKRQRVTETHEQVGHFKEW